MDIVQAVSGYITKIVSAGDSAATGTTAAKMKILLLDNETVGLSPPSKPSRALHTVHRDHAIRSAQP
jgi:vacuolar protein sorting-associated protein 45